MSGLTEPGGVMTLRQLREAHHLTQERIAIPLGITQDQVSRLEQRGDLKVSTLRNYIEALGGRLSIVIEFPNEESVALSGLAALDVSNNVRKRRCDSKLFRRGS